MFALVRERGRTVSELLAELLPAVIAAPPLAEVDALGRWRFPVGAAAAVDPVPVRRRRGALRDRRHRDWPTRTRGHRFMAPAPFAVRDFADYVVKLRAAKVILDGAERRRDHRARRGRAGGWPRARRRGRPGAARRGQGSGRMASAAVGRDRRGVHGGAARGAGHHHAERTRNTWRCARRTARWRRQFVLVANIAGERRRGGDRRRQRARAARPAVGRQVLLGPGPQGLAGEPPAGARAHGVPCRARLAGPTSRAAGGAVERLGTVACPAPTECWPSARRC